MPILKGEKRADIEYDFTLTYRETPVPKIYDVINSGVRDDKGKTVSFKGSGYVVATQSDWGYSNHPVETTVYVRTPADISPESVYIVAPPRSGFCQTRDLTHEEWFKLHQEVKKEGQDAKDKLVYGFYEEEYPSYSYEAGAHESLSSLVTPEELNGLVDQLKKAHIERDDAKAQERAAQKGARINALVNNSLVKQLSEAQSEVARLREALRGIADMPDYDQDNEHRLRHMAKRALEETK